MTPSDWHGATWATPTSFWSRVQAAELPKIEVFRRSAGSPLYDPATPNAGEWAAIVTDEYDFEADCQVLHFQDTMWLQLLANLAWEQAMILPP